MKLALSREAIQIVLLQPCHQSEIGKPALPKTLSYVIINTATRLLFVN